MGPRERIRLGWGEVETIPAYNVDKFRNGKALFHPKENEGLGFVLTLGGKRLYVAGDTDGIPEMENIKNIDIAFLPVGRRTVMAPEEAARAASIIKPKVAIPVHWEKREDAERFAHLAGNAMIL